MHQRSAPSSVFLVAALLSACSSQPSDCACAEDAFCCLGTCLPLGSTCPPRDAAVSDAETSDASTVDCGARPTPDGGSATSASRCMGDAVWYCTSAPTPCNAGYECVEWLDVAAGVFRASCVDGGGAPCDPTAADTCDSTTLVRCQATGQPPSIGPPGLTVRQDCPTTFGPMSTCVTDGTGAHCTTESCDASTYVSSCRADESFALCRDGALGYQTCIAGLRCLANDLTAPDATCVPVGATTSTTRTPDLTVLGCLGDALLVAQWGYQWGEACMGTYVCRGAGGAARCRSPDSLACDVASYVTVCAPDGIEEIRCTDGFTEPFYCGIPLASDSVPSACDDTTGRCVPTGFCAPGTADRCDASGRYRIHCEESWGQEVADVCAGCSVDGTGSLVCG